jgi:CRISPR-associated protein Csd1
MILQSLASYYDRLLEEGRIEPPGLQMKEIPWVVTLDARGRVLGLTRTGDGKRGKRFAVPAEVKKSVNIAANLLWDNPEYVFGVPRPGLTEAQAAKVPQRRQTFVERLRALPDDLRADEGVAAILAFFTANDLAALEADSQWPDLIEGSGNVSFRLDGDPGLVCERPAVRTFLLTPPDDPGPEQDSARCLVTGDAVPSARLHPSVKGVRGAQSMGANLVSFNLDSFVSHGWAQGGNAPVGVRSAQAYVGALNTLLGPGEPSHRHFEGDTTFVFWAAAKTPLEEDAFDHLLGGLPASVESDGKSVPATLASLRNGLAPLLADETPFYVLGLAPNAARLSVRLWYHGKVAELAGRFIEHFDDLDVVGLPDNQRLGLWNLLGAAAIGGDAKRLQDNLRGVLAAGLVDAILSGRPYPETLLARAVGRCRAEQSAWPARVALIKAVMNRRARLFHAKKGEISMSLDERETNVGYLMGRLFAILEKIQRTAQPNINTTIRDRYFGAAIVSPRSVFVSLMTLKDAHLKKLRRGHPGYAIHYEKLIGAVVGALTSATAFPPTLALDDQGRFIVGYHHQTQAFYTKSEEE